MVPSRCYRGTTATVSTTTTRLPVPLLANHAHHTPKIETGPARGARGGWQPALITHMTVRAAAPPP
jgi:hypothetical protein